MTEEEKQKRLEKARESKRRWWAKHGKEWKQKRKIREVLEQDEPKGPAAPA